MAFTSSAEIDTLAGVRFLMADQTPDDLLVGRESGQRARSLLEQEMHTHRLAEDPVAIDFDGVRGMTVPFAHEFFVPLLGGRLAGYYDEHPVFVINAVEDVASTLEIVLRNSDLAVLSLHGYAGPLLGGEPALQQAMKIAQRLEDFTANDLSAELGVSAQAANNRLKQLVRIGALLRVPVVLAAGGREYRYQLPGATTRTQQA
jgi:hypothetical protein